MNPLLIVLPFCNADVEPAKRQLTWIAELENSDTYIPYPILLAADSAVPIETCKEIKGLAARAFRYVLTTTVRVDAKDWKAPNLMFHGVSQLVRDTYKMPFLWMEPDAIPLRAGWADAIAGEYARCAEKYMGALIPSTDPGLPALHMTGCSVYPNDAYNVLAKHSDEKAASAWDISSAGDIVGRGRAKHTSLIQHLYGQKDLAPTFVSKKEQGREYPINTMELSQLNPSAVLFHRSKDGTLIIALREARVKTETVAVAPQSTASVIAQMPLAPKNKGGRPRKNPLPVAVNSGQPTTTTSP